MSVMRTLAGLSLVLALSLVASIARAADHSELEESMEKLNKAAKALKDTVGDAAKTADSIALVLEMQKQAVAGKAQEPAKAKKLNGADKAKFMAEYRKSMNGLLAELIKLENALNDGKNPEAQDIFKGLTKLKTEGHEKFQEG